MNFDPVLPSFDNQKFLKAHMSHNFFRSLEGSNHSNLFPKFGELCCDGSVILCGDMHQSFTDAVVVAAWYAETSFTVFIAALCNREGHYIFALWFLLNGFAPNSQGRRDWSLARTFECQSQRSKLKVTRDKNGKTAASSTLTVHCKACAVGCK